MAKKEAKPLTKAQLVAHLAESASITKKDVLAVLDELTALAYMEATKEKGFTLPGLGTLVRGQRKARMGRNPKTGEPIKIKARTALKFRVAKQAKDAILA